MLLFEQGAVRKLCKRVIKTTSPSRCHIPLFMLEDAMAQRKRVTVDAATLCLTHPYADLQRLADWLETCNVDTVAMASTGVYWRALYELLASRGFTVLLVNARHVKNVSGRKSDVLDCQWLTPAWTTWSRVCKATGAPSISLPSSKPWARLTSVAPNCSSVMRRSRRSCTPCKAARVSPAKAMGMQLVPGENRV